MSHETVLEARNITKTFPGVKALDGVSFDLRRGEIHALVGENGAGKSTLMHILAGIFPPDSGEIRLEGQPVRLESPYAAARRGIGVVFQELSLVPQLTVAENIFANRQMCGPLGLIRFPEMRRRARELLSLFEVDIDPDVLVGALSTGRQQMIEILKALSQDPKVLILDEPTASLTQSEADHLFRHLNRLKERGIAIIFISHHLQEVFQLADRVTVLRDGRRVGTAPKAELTEQKLVQMMVGRELVAMYGSRKPEEKVGEEFFRVEGIGRAGLYKDVSFSVRRGEIVGVAGLVGSGRTEVARGIFGVEPIDQGQIWLNGQPVRIRRPHDAIARRIAYLTEDRKIQGLYLNMTVAENCVAPSLARFTRTGFLQEARIREFAEECVRAFRIITPSVHQKVMNLSGGNQQKVLLSMWSGIQPELLMVDEPTKGVDVGAKQDVYEFLRRLAGRGVGIIVISSDLPEVLGISDRILVMRQGRLVGEVPGSEATEERVMALATGVAGRAS